MENILYTKFSNQRREEFEISTSIVEDDTKKYILKTALYNSGRKHLLQMIENQHRMKKILSECGWSVASCVARDEDSIEVEFIKGRTLESIINEKLSNGEYQQVLTILSRIADKIYHNSHIAKFEKSSRFDEIFGEIEFQHSLKAFDLSNVDMIFPNFLIEDGKYTLIDYEWIFDFKIPLEYILFRSLFYNAAIQKLEDEQKLELYECMQIDVKDISIFEKMEYAFQSYVKGENKNFTEIYQAINNKAIPLKYLGGDVATNNYSLYIGTDKILKASTFQTSVDIKVCEVPEHSTIRVNLNDQNGIYKLKSAIGLKDGLKEDLELIESNSELVIVNDYYYIQDTPYMIFKNKEYESLEISYSILSKKNNLVGNLVTTLKNEYNMNLQITEIKSYSAQKEDELNQYKQRAIEYEEAYKTSASNNAQLNEAHTELAKSYEELAKSYEELTRNYDIINTELDEIHSRILWKIGDKIRSVGRRKED